MSFNDRALTCAKCSTEFTFTADDQEFHAKKGYQEPKRCPDCRRQRRAGGGGGDYGGGGYGRPAREMFSATCASCGNEAQVPFEPSQDRPVYCSDCFSKVKPEGGGGGRSSSW